MTKVQVAILWGLSLLVLVVFVVVGQVVSKRPQGSSPLVITAPAQVYSLPDIPQSARSFYWRADQAARSWQGDAALVSAAAAWPFVRLDDLSMPTDWTFQFFSPSTSMIYVVNVSETEVTPIREALAPYPLSTVALEDWQLDSPKALNTWLNNNGGVFLRLHPIVDVNARLRRSKGGELEWIVAGVGRNSQNVQLVRIDASSGVVMQ
jgi:hypothetical protein